MSPRENNCPSLSSTTSATQIGGLWAARVWSPALQAGPVLIFLLHSPSRSRGRKYTSNELRNDREVVLKSRQGPLDTP